MIFAECGIMSYDKEKRASATYMRGVSYRIPASCLSISKRTREVLFQGMSWKVKTTRIRPSLRNVRYAVLSPLWRAGHRRARATVLLTAMLHRLACGESISEHVFKNRPRPLTSRSRGSGSRQAANFARSCSSHRQQQTKQSSIESGGFPISVASRAMSQRRDVR